MLVFLKNVVKLTLHTVDNVLLFHFHYAFQIDLFAFQLLHRTIQIVDLKRNFASGVAFQEALVVACQSFRVGVYAFPSPIVRPRKRSRHRETKSQNLFLEFVDNILLFRLQLILQIHFLMGQFSFFAIQMFQLEIF